MIHVSLSASSSEPGLGEPQMDVKGYSRLSDNAWESTRANRTEADGPGA